MPLDSGMDTKRALALFRQEALDAYSDTFGAPLPKVGLGSW